MDEPKKMDLRSMDIAEEHKLKLKQIFPHVFNEDKIDFEQLKQTLGEDIDIGLERFGLTWPGKSECMKIIQQPSIGTLKPCKEESVNFDATENLFIEGDNLEVLKLLQKSYYGKVKMIYIDPPYNTGKEFIYPDKYSETLETYLAYTGQADAEGKKFSTNTEADGRFHSKWINMMYPRLYLARNLLMNDGLLFVSIGQSEFSNLICMCNEIFGEENKVSICTRLMKTGGQKGKFFSPNTDYVVIYAKNIVDIADFRDELSDELINKVYTQIEKEGSKKGEKYREMGLFQPSLDIRANQRYFIKCPDGTLAIPPGKTMPVDFSEGSQCQPVDGDGVWRWTYGRYKTELKEGNIVFKETKDSPLITDKKTKSRWNVYTKIWLKDRLEEGKLPLDMFEKFENRHSAQELNEIAIQFDYAKPSELIAYLISICGTKENDVILDFFAGSGTTAHSVFKANIKDSINRRFVLVQLPEKCEEESEAFKNDYKTIADIGKERIRRVIKKFQEESKEQLNFKNDKMDLGFKVFKLDQSNFKIWDGVIDQVSDGKKIEKQLELQIEHINPKATEEEILYELLLKSGFALTTQVEALQMAGKRVYSIENGALLVCLEKNLTKELITEMARKEPARVICLDSGFSGNDQLKTNAVQIMKSHKVEDFRTV